MNKWFGLILVDCRAYSTGVHMYMVTVIRLPYHGQLAEGHLKIVPELQGNCSPYS